MEAPLSAHEFLKRFHLPQLVRLSGPSNGKTKNKNADDGSLAEEPGARAGLERAQSPARRSNTSASSSFVALNTHHGQTTAEQQAPDQQHQQHVQSDWTYLAANGNSPSLPGQVSGRSRQELVPAGTQPNKRFSATATSTASSSWASSGTGAGKSGDEQVQVSSSGTGEPGDGEADVRELAIRLAPPSKRPALSKLSLNQPFLLYKAYKKLELCAYVIDLKNELNEKSGDPIYFPQDYPGWFSLANQPHVRPNELGGNSRASGQNQPRPLESIEEVCQAGAQVFLSRDELLAYQLPSKLSHLTKLKNNQLLALPLAINLSKANQVSQHNLEQGYGASGGGKDQGAASGAATGAHLAGSHTATAPAAGATGNNISDIRQVVIQCGQTLKICGVYEDVLPLIEGSKQQQQQQHHQHNHNQNQQPAAMAALKSAEAAAFCFDGSPSCSLSHYQMASPAASAAQFYHQMAPPAVQAPKQLYNGYSISAARLHPNQRQSVAAASHAAASVAARDQSRLVKMRGFNCTNHYAASPLIYSQTGPQGHQFPPLPPAPPLPARCAGGPKLRGRGHERNQAQVQGGPGGPAGQRYARCVLLSQRSVDRATSGSGHSGCHEQRATRFDPAHTGELEAEEEVEVLIPIEQRGRFYLCATNELFCLGCGAAQMPSLVFRLSQIVAMLHMTKRIRQQQEQQNKLAARAPERRVGCESVRLPLSVRLVMGPRPGNFSPSMFGSSSSMESYFSHEANVGGHSLRCAYNRSGQQQHQVRGDTYDFGHAGPQASGPVCGCALRLCPWPGSFNSGAGGPDINLGLFSAALRFERLLKRDVLLACSIKQDPLVHLNLLAGGPNEQELGGGGDAVSAALGRGLERPAMSSIGLERLQLAATASCRGEPSRDRPHSSRLMALREPGAGSNNHDQLATVAGKSSFSRLRVCRSLISLNGRRKRRPNIPSSMMSANNSGPGREAAPLSLPPGGALSAHLSSGPSSLFTGDHEHHITAGGATSGLYGPNSSNSGASSYGASGGIVMLEFDCNEPEPRFVRTFVESSLPTSSIPDLVLNRLEFCHRNSACWERQVKLSYRALSRDFDLCQGQIEQSRSISLARLKEQEFLLRQHQAPVEHNNNNNNNQLIRRSAAAGQQRPTTITAPHKADGASHSASVRSPRHAHSLMGASAHSSSTASSRSSSGVSSSGEPRAQSSGQLQAQVEAKRQQLAGLNSACSTSKLSNGSAPGCEESGKGSASSNNHSPTSTGANHLAAGAHQSAANSSRLLRLVQRILPPFGAPPTAPAAAGQASEGAKSRQLVVELSERFERQLVVDCGAPGLNLANEPSTLMNAQKVHRRLTGSASKQQQQPVPLVTTTLLHNTQLGLERGQVREELDDDNKEFQYEKQVNGDNNNEEHKQQDEDDQDSGSHLYESLERLNEARLSRRRTSSQSGMATGTGVPGTGIPGTGKGTCTGAGAGGSGGTGTPGTGRPGRGSSFEGARRLGKSIEFLAVGGRRMSALVSGAHRRSQERAERGFFDEDEDDEWWRESTGSGGGHEKTPVPVRSTSETQRPRLRLGQAPAGGEKPLVRVEQQRRRPMDERRFTMSDQVDCVSRTQAQPQTQAVAARTQSRLAATRRPAGGKLQAAEQWPQTQQVNRRRLKLASELEAGSQADQVTSRPAELDECAMEPVSIEACNEDFVSMVDDDDVDDCEATENDDVEGGNENAATSFASPPASPDEQASGGNLSHRPGQVPFRLRAAGGARSERTTHRALIDGHSDLRRHERPLAAEGQSGEQGIYVNLCAADGLEDRERGQRRRPTRDHWRSSFELGQQHLEEALGEAEQPMMAESTRPASKGRPASSRMERKLMRIRGRANSRRPAEMEEQAEGDRWAGCALERPRSSLAAELGWRRAEEHEAAAEAAAGEWPPPGGDEPGPLSSSSEAMGSNEWSRSSACSGPLLRSSGRFAERPPGGAVGGSVKQANSLRSLPLPGSWRHLASGAGCSGSSGGSGELPGAAGSALNSSSESWSASSLSGGSSLSSSSSAANEPPSWPRASLAAKALDGHGNKAAAVGQVTGRSERPRRGRPAQNSSLATLDRSPGEAGASGGRRRLVR